MQVKKFEAKSMKEALQMIKQELGPEAIILQAKSRKSGFGLVGGESVEVTAAISEKALTRRQVAESHLPEQVRGNFRGRSATHQRQFIDDVFDKIQTEADSGAVIRTSSPAPTGPVRGRSPASTRYIDIADEAQPAARSNRVGGRTVDDLLDEVNKGSAVLDDAANGVKPQLAPESGRVSSKIKGLSAQAAQSLATFLKKQMEEEPAVWSGRQDEVLSLKNEVEGLRKMLAEGKVVASTFPGSDYGLPYELSAAFERLQQAGIDTRYIAEILDRAHKELTPMEKKKKSLVDAWVARFILAQVNISRGWDATKATVHFFVGPNGQGKTSTIVKLASHLVLQEKKRIAIFSTDTMKVGAADQLRIYANILGVPFEVIRGHYDYQTLPTKHRDKDMILVDMPGFSLRDMAEIDQIKNLLPPAHFSRQTHLVLSCTLRDLDAYELCHRYQVAKFDDVVATKLDESFNHGILYNIQRRTERPLFAFGIGPKIPEDIEMATRERVLDLIFKISKNSR